MGLWKELLKKNEQTAFEPVEVEDRYVWCDPLAYRLIRRRVAPILVLAVLAGVVPYVAGLRRYTDGLFFCALFGGLVALVPLLLLRKRFVTAASVFVRAEGRLYRITDANRGLTKVAEDVGADAPWFWHDLQRARRSRCCWEIVKIDECLERDKEGPLFTAQVRIGERTGTCVRQFELPRIREDDALSLLIDELFDREKDEFVSKT